jgi:hypothetical protein
LNNRPEYVSDELAWKINHVVEEFMSLPEYDRVRLGWIITSSEVNGAEYVKAAFEIFSPFVLSEVTGLPETDSLGDGHSSYEKHSNPIFSCGDVEEVLLCARYFRDHFRNGEIEGVDGVIPT